MGKFSTHTTTKHLFEHNGIELELPYSASEIHAYNEPLIYEMNGKLLLGYLSEDDDCMNPLEDCDGMGHIYSAAQRSGGREENSKFRQALGLDSNWDPDLSLVDEEEVIGKCHDLIKESYASGFIKGGIAEDTFKAMLEDCNDNYVRDEGDETDLDFVLNCLDTEDDLNAFLDTESVREKLWVDGRDKGTIGDKHAVSLDVYEHGGISYNVSGRGRQCLFDTAKGGAVWIPDECAREELLSRAKVYVKGEINESSLKTKNQYNIRTFDNAGELTAFTGEPVVKYDDVVHPPFEHWHEAFEYLKNLNLTPEQMTRSQDQAEYVAAQELAQQACEVYTSWCNGDCYGIVVVQYDLTGQAEGNVDEGEEKSADWGFVGGDYALRTLQEEFDSWKKQM